MKPLSARVVGSLAAAGVLAWGVALAEEDVDHLYLQTPGISISAKVTNTDITGPQLQLSHSPEAIRGRAYERPVNLQINDKVIGGLIGNLPVRLTLDEQPDFIGAKGTFAGIYTDLKIGRDGLTGRVGNCSYELKAKVERYEGWRSCGGPPEYPVFVEVPPALARNGAPTTVAGVALLLAQ